MTLNITKPSPGDPTGWGTTLNAALDAIVAGVNAQTGTFETLTGASTKYARKLVPGSRLVRSRVGAAVLTTTPTFSASAAGTLGTAIGRGDPRFRISGGIQYNNGVTGLGLPRGARKTDGTFSPFAGSWRQCFDFDGQTFEFSTVPGTSTALRIWVNDQPHSVEPVLMSTITGYVNNTTNWIKVDLGSRAQRRIMVETISPSQPGGVNGWKFNATDSLAPPSIGTSRIMWVGDSIAYGIGAASGLQRAYPIEASWLLGIDDVWITGAVPSTGLIATSAPYGNYANRFTDDVQSVNPDILVVQSSINDAASWPANQGLVGPALTSYLATARAALPNAIIVVVSPIYAAAPSASHTALRDEVQAAAVAAGYPFIDAMSSTSPVFTGTGQIGATTGDGNADFYRESGGVKTHPSDAGHRFLAYWMAGRLGPLIGQAV